MNSYDENLSLTVMCNGTSLARPPDGIQMYSMLQHSWDEAATTENVLDSKKTDDLSTSSSTTVDNFQLAQSNISSFFLMISKNSFTCSAQANSAWKCVTTKRLRD
jgi:hypothetical protein